MTKQPPFMPFHQYVAGLLDDLERKYLVQRTQPAEFPWYEDIERFDRPPIALVPLNPGEAPLNVAFPAPEPQARPTGP